MSFLRIFKIEVFSWNCLWSEFLTQNRENLKVASWGHVSKLLVCANDESLLMIWKGTRLPTWCVIMRFYQISLHYHELLSTYYPKTYNFYEEMLEHRSWTNKMSSWPQIYYLSPIVSLWLLLGIISDQNLDLT